MLRQLVERFGADHVLLGTDYPYDMGVEDPVGFIGGTRGLSAAERGSAESIASRVKLVERSIRRGFQG